MEALRLTRSRDGAVRFEVRARPRARVSRVAGVRAGALVVEVAAPPADGAANEELIATLARALSTAKRQLELVRGHTSHLKLVEVRGLSEEETAARLLAAASDR